MSPTGHTAWPLPIEALRSTLSLALELEQSPMGVVLLRDEVTGLFHPALGEGLVIDDYESLGGISADDGAFGKALLGRERTTFTRAAAEDGALSALAEAVGFDGLTVVPFPLADGPLAGAFAIMFRAPAIPTGDAEKQVARCAALAAHALEQARQRWQAEEEQAHAEALSRARLQFLARMAHELRTPLQSIAGYVDLLCIGMPDRPSLAQSRVLDRVRRSERVLSSVIDDLITYARIEAGRVEYHISGVAAADALHATTVVVSPLAAERRITLVAEPCDRTLTVHADPDKLLQILINLAANALKFTPSGGTVRLGCTTGPGARVTFHVSDTGRGIPRDKLEEIFTPYVQLGIPILDGAGGSGLGLAISREFATGMKGELTVESGIDAGSTFYLRLPVYQSPSRRTRHALDAIAEAAHTG